MIKLRPIGSRILIQRLDLPEQSIGGLFVLGREYPTIGKILAIGKGKYRKKYGEYRFDLPEVDIGFRSGDRLSVGDQIQFSREAIRRGQEIEKDIIILDHEQCLIGITNE